MKLQIKPMKDEPLEKFQKRVENIVSRSLSESFKGATGEEMTAKEIKGLKKAVGEWHKKNLYENCDQCDGTGLIEFEFKVDPKKDDIACGYRPCPDCLEKIIYDRARREEERKKKEKEDMRAREARIADRIDRMMPGTLDTKFIDKFIDKANGEDE